MKKFILVALNNSLLKYCLSVFIIFSLFFAIGAGCRFTMYSITNRLYKPIEEANQLKEKFFLTNSVNSYTEIMQVKYLKMQYQTISFAKQHHKETGRVYYVNYYTFSVVLVIASIVTAILLAIIANTGWQLANPFIKVSFFSLFAISSFFGILMVTLNQKENYENNFKQYLFYDKVQNNMLTFMNTSQKVDSFKSVHLIDSFIVAVNNDLRINNQFFMDIDANKISFDEISSKLGKSVNGNTK